jgi:hypothetical protein
MNGNMELRRRAPRVATPDWWGTHTDADDARYCKVIDISVLGVELFGDVANDLIGHRLTIEDPSSRWGVLRRTVKNVSLGSDGTTRAGLGICRSAWDRAGNPE